MLLSGCDRFGASARCLHSWKIHLRRLATTAEQHAEKPHYHRSADRQRRPRTARPIQNTSPNNDNGSPSFTIRRTDSDPPPRDYVQRGSIPFESFRHTLPSHNALDLNRNTLTRGEGRAFRKLQGVDAPQITAHEPANNPVPPSRSSPLSALDDLLDSIQSEVSGVPVTKANAEAQKTGKEEEENSPFSITSRRSRDRNLQERREWRLNQNSAYWKTTLEIQAAESDLEIWEILQREVFEPVAAFHLEGPSIQLGNFPGAAVNRFHDVGITQVDPLETIGANFSRILIVAAEALRKSFPTSPIQLSLIPELRKLGPTYHALGVTTELYNYALEHALKQDQDLTGGLEILDDMDREVIEPNETTLSILQYIVRQARVILKGEYGHGVRLLWQTERNRTALKEFRYRASKLQELYSKEKLGKTVSERTLRHNDDLVR